MASRPGASVSDDPTSPPPRAPRSPWVGAALVLGAMLLLHVGLGLVLTRGARATLTEIEGLHSAEQLAAAHDPGSMPEVAGPAYGEWTRAQRLNDDARRHADRSGQVRALTLGLVASFLMQAGFVVTLAARAARASGRRP